MLQLSVFCLSVLNGYIPTGESVGFEVRTLGFKSQLYFLLVMCC